MSQSTFIELGLCQPAWVAIEAQNHYSHVAIAYMKYEVEEEEMKRSETTTSGNIVWLTPMLAKAFEGAQELSIRSCVEQIQSGPKICQELMDE